MIKIMIAGDCYILNIGDSHRIFKQQWKREEKTVCHPNKKKYPHLCWADIEIVDLPAKEQVIRVPKGYNCPKIVNKSNWQSRYKYDDTFEITQEGRTVKVRRTDPYVVTPLVGKQQRGARWHNEHDWCENAGMQNMSKAQCKKWAESFGNTIEGIPTKWKGTQHHWHYASGCNHEYTNALPTGNIRYNSYKTANKTGTKCGGQYSNSQCVCLKSAEETRKRDPNKLGHREHQSWDMKLKFKCCKNLKADKKKGCDETIKGSKENGYLGCQNKTISGRTCQKWTRQSPHGHSNTPEKKSTKGYCTSNWKYDSSGSYTPRKSIKCGDGWNVSCHKSRGCFCSKAGCTPNPNRTAYTTYDLGLGDHNYCRNPDGESGGIWCYTTDPKKRWEYCDPKCPNGDETIKGTKEDGYRGCQNKTISGRTCQRWDRHSPHGHSNHKPSKGAGSHNYCRNPDGEPGGIWCYTTDRRKRWEYCDPIR